VKSKTSSRWAALAVLAALTLAGCTGGGDKKSAAEGEVEQSGTEVPTTTAANTMEELAERLEISVPEGYILQPDEVGDTGPSDLEKAIRDDGEDDAREVLTRTRFVRGYQRMWSRSEDDEIIAYVYQFADNAGAVEYTNRLTADAGAQTPGVTIERFSIGSINGSVGVNGSDANFATSTCGPTRSRARGPGISQSEEPAARNGRREPGVPRAAMR
jgi:hypothetical protein